MERYSPMEPPPAEVDVLVVGAGLAGLSCALLLERKGVNVHVVDVQDGVGGRVRTDRVGGFRLDRGFQVLLTADSEVQGQVDLPRLEPRPFVPGALVWTGTRLERMPDPFRRPLSVLAAARARVGGIGDKLRLARLGRRLLREPPEACFLGTDRSTLEELELLGFTDDFIDGFFRPFLGGVFLERALETSAQLFRYYFRSFAAGPAVLPARGMQELPELLAMPLEERISLGARVVEVRPTSVRFDSGSSCRARQVVVAADGAGAAELLDFRPPTFKATITAYFAAPEAPVDHAMVILDGEGSGPVNHAAVPSLVSQEYAPPGAHLVAASGVDAAAADPEAFRAGATEQLRRWFGPSVQRWEHLRTYRIAHALPTHAAGTLSGGDGAPARFGETIVAGDYRVFGAIHGALRSGRRAARAALEGLD